MPNSIIKSFAEKTGKTEQQIDKLWEKAKSIVTKEYPDVEVDSDKFYQLVVGVLKKMLSINEDGESAPAITLSDVPSYYKPITIKTLDRSLVKKKRNSKNYFERIDYHLQKDN